MRLTSVVSHCMASLYSEKGMTFQKFVRVIHNVYGPLKSIFHRCNPAFGRRANQPRVRGCRAKSDKNVIYDVRALQHWLVTNPWYPEAEARCKLAAAAVTMTALEPSGRVFTCCSVLQYECNIGYCSQSSAACCQKPHSVSCWCKLSYRSDPTRGGIQHHVYSLLVFRWTRLCTVILPFSITMAVTEFIGIFWTRKRLPSATDVVVVVVSPKAFFISEPIVVKLRIHTLGLSTIAPYNAVI